MKTSISKSKRIAFAAIAIAVVIAVVLLLCFAKKGDASKQMAPVQAQSAAESAEPTEEILIPPTRDENEGPLDENSSPGGEAFSDEDIEF